MQTSPDQPSPSPRRLLTLYFTARQPALLLVDALLALTLYEVLYHVWSLLYHIYVPLGDDDLTFVQSLINPVLWIGPFVTLIRYFAWIVVGVAAVRYIGDSLRSTRSGDRDSRGEGNAQ